MIRVRRRFGAVKWLALVVVLAMSWLGLAALRSDSSVPEGEEVGVREPTPVETLDVEHAVPLETSSADEAGGAEDPSESPTLVLTSGAFVSRSVEVSWKSARVRMNRVGDDGVELTYDTASPGAKPRVASAVLSVGSDWSMRIEWDRRRTGPATIAAIDPEAWVGHAAAPLEVRPLSTTLPDGVESDVTVLVRRMNEGLRVVDREGLEVRVRHTGRTRSARGVSPDPLVVQGIPVGIPVSVTYWNAAGGHVTVDHVHTGEPLSIDVRDGVHLRGRVVDQHGDPVSGVLLSLRFADEGPERPSPWNADHLDRSKGDGTFDAHLPKRPPTWPLSVPVQRMPLSGTVAFGRSWHDSLEIELDLPPGSDIDLGDVVLASKPAELLVVRHGPIRANTPVVYWRQGSDVLSAPSTDSRDLDSSTYELTLEGDAFDPDDPPAHVLLVGYDRIVGAVRKGDRYVEEPTRRLDVKTRAPARPRAGDWIDVQLQWRGIRASLFQRPPREALNHHGFAVPEEGASLLQVEIVDGAPRPPVDLGPVDPLPAVVDLVRGT